jgi:hypothetical protein
MVFSLGWRLCSKYWKDVRIGNGDISTSAKSHGDLVSRRWLDEAIVLIYLKCCVG